MFGANPFGWPYFGQAFLSAGGSNEVDVPLISSVTVVYTPDVVNPRRLSQEAAEVLRNASPHALLSQESLEILRANISGAAGLSQVSAEVLRQVQHELDLPFIASTTTVYNIFSIFSNLPGSGPGNGGETFAVALAPNGTSVTATLASGITSSSTLLSMNGDSGFPTSGGFCVTIDSEVIYLEQITAGSYRVRDRGVSNTTPASHTAGATATWNDHYDMAILATSTIGHDFTANITATGSTTYPGWLICFESSQAYLAGSHYPMHVTSVLGVFDVGAGSGGSNRCDGVQPNAICTTAVTSDDCPVALSNPSRISSDIAIGDVALVRYTNPEASVLTLGPRSVALQSWFGLKRVDATDNDVTFTDTNGIVVDTTGGEGTFTGSVNGEWNNPLGPGISPDSGQPTNHDVPYTSVALLGTKRFFTFGSPHFNEKGWPICALAVRQGTRRVPLWQSWDWHDYNYVYNGFVTDATFCQLLVNSNGIVFGSVPEVNLPGPQDIDGPDAVWDDGSYRFGASWYVAIYGTPYLVIGPSIGGAGTSPSGGTGNGFVPIVDFTGGTGSPTITVPTQVQGGSGGNINPPAGGKERFDAQIV